MSERLTVARLEDRVWIERMVERGGNVWARAADRVGIEALAECYAVMGLGAPLWRADLRRKPWAGNPELKEVLLEARAAMSALYEAAGRVVWDE